MHDNYNGDDRFYNNIFAAPAKDGQSVLNEELRRQHKPGKLAKYDDETMPLLMKGNLYLNGAIPQEKDLHPEIIDQETAAPELIHKKDGWYLQLSPGASWGKGLKRELITTGMLGRALIPDMPYEQADGSAVEIDADYSGKARNRSNPFPGPFTELKEGKQLIRVWPKN